MWYRSWPTDDEIVSRNVGRPHVVDRLPRLLMSNFDYLTVEEWPSDPHGFCLLEWDVALDQRNRSRFERHVKADRDRVLVAPYHYGLGGWLPDVAEGQPAADAFGFGCIYFPQTIISAAVAEFRTARGADGATRLTDMTFSTWHHARHGSARVVWDVHPQHLREF